MAKEARATRREVLRMVVVGAAIGFDLWIAASPTTWGLADGGFASVLGWYAARAAGAVAALALLLVLRATTRAEQGMGGAVPAGAGSAVLRLSVGVVALYLVLLAVGVVALRAGWFELSTLPRDISSRDEVARALLEGCLVAPIVEELVYRGLAVPALRAHAGPRTTVLLSGLLFWALHVVYGYPVWLVHYVLAGMILAWAFLRTNRLWVAVLLHALGNVLMVADDLVRLYAPDVVRTLLGPRGQSLV